MTGTFSTLSTALSSLNAQRQALDVAGQNIANANTVGYTRQRANLQSISAMNVASIHSGVALTSGTGTSVVSLARLSDQFLDARLRTQTAQQASSETLATTLESLEAVVPEPSDTGLSSTLGEFWSGWQDLANSPDSASARTVVLGNAQTLGIQLADTYRSFQSQWDQARAQADSLVSTVNSTAASIADLNQQIRGVLVSGGSANELMDQRDQLVTQLSGLVGATATTQADGTMTVLVGGNPLVSSDHANTIEVAGSYVMSMATAEPPSTDAVSLQWSNGTALTLTGGSLAATVTALQPTSLGGPISHAVDAVNDLATRVATQVNAIHTTGTDLNGNAGGDFFTFAAGLPPALGLTVAISDPDAVAAANGANGALDGSIADQISQLGTATDGPDKTWQAFVVDLGVTTAASRRRADVAETTRASAETQQLSNASVDIDEEMTNMLAYQHAYEGAARVMTAIDEMLDTLINRTGTVGR
ncbi:flagellar hook-associated protein FlgK [Demequina capsici]|uniref:Flagellar hook-associated protein 1 n=1 Tax=Demequina capsici TaxID=3075620 RepID=A0AA96FC25_9MICO|nr:flagellar hook-associated protein FlgK [Demequina sp. PMTSA13]WNM27393.1 flagellar hook-associated protein FlgK [Demequina sp. PMTSA13]